MKTINFHIALLSLILTLSFSIYAQNQNESVRKASELMKQGDFRGGIKILDAALEQNQNSFEAYGLRGNLKRMTGDFSGAFKDFSSALEIKSDRGELYEQRALMRLYLGQSPDLIISDLDAAISYGRRAEKIYSLRGSIKMQIRDEDGAIADFQTAIGLRPDFAGAANGLATAYRMLGKDEKAFEVLQNFIKTFEESGTSLPGIKAKVVAASSNRVPTSSSKIVIAERTQIYEGEPVKSQSVPSIEEMDKMNDLMEQTKNTAAAYSALAALYYQKKDNQRAKELLETSLKIDSNEFTVYETLAKIKRDEGDLNGAIGDFTSFLKMMPKVPFIYLERGITYLKAGNQPEAQKDFDMFLQLFPKGKTLLDKRVEEVNRPEPVMTSKDQ